MASSTFDRFAAACGVPYAWFTIPDLKEAVANGEEATLSERVEALERRVDAQITELRAGLVALSADTLRRTLERQEQIEMGHQPGLQGGDN